MIAKVNTMWKISRHTPNKTRRKNPDKAATYIV